MTGLADVDGYLDACLAHLVRHWTPKPVIISCTRSSPTGCNFFLLLLNPLNTKLPFLPTLYKLWKTRLFSFTSYSILLYSSRKNVGTLLFCGKFLLSLSLVGCVHRSELCAGDGFFMDQFLGTSTAQGVAAMSFRTESNEFSRMLVTMVNRTWALNLETLGRGGKVTVHDISEWKPLHLSN